MEALILLHPLSLLLARVCSTWKAIVLGRKQEGIEKERKGGGGEKEHSSTVLVSFPRHKAGNPSASDMLGLAPPPLPGVHFRRSHFHAVVRRNRAAESGAALPQPAFRLSTSHVIHPGLRSASHCVLRNGKRFF